MSLRWKFTISTVVLVVAIGTILSWNFIAHERQALLDQMIERGKSLAKNLAAACEWYFTTPAGRSKKKIEEALKTRLYGMLDVSYAVVHDTKDEKFVVKFPESVIADVLQGEILSRALEAEEMQIQHLDRLNCIEFSVPVIGRIYGGEEYLGDLEEEVEKKPESTETAPERLALVRVGISLERVSGQIRDATQRGIILTAAIIGIAVVLLNVMITLLMRPLSLLTEGTEKLSRGELDFNVEVRSKDEMGILAKAFNDMAVKLKDSHDRLLSTNFELSQANEQLKKWSETLESQVAERTKSLQETNAKLQRAMAEKEDFLRAISHDLNAPLRNIAGITELIIRKQRDSGDADLIERLNRVKLNVEKESELIADLLELSRIKSRRQKFQLASVQQILEEIKSQLSFQLEQKHIHIVIEDGMPIINCERNRIRQIFQNLLDNAVKYIGENPAPCIEVGFENMDGFYRFHITDNGIGIAPEDQERLFFVFRRAKNPLVAKVEGKGVGLATVKQIVETYGGEIWVESELGKGTTFFFTLAKEALKEHTSTTESPPPA